MSHYTKDCNWGCEYNLERICKRCRENILSFRNKWVEYLKEHPIYNEEYFKSEEYKELINKLHSGLISFDEYSKIVEYNRDLKLNILSVNSLDSLNELSPWQKDPDASHCWLRTIKNGDPNNIKDRRVFVEKTPRVFDPSLNLDIKNCQSWIQGYKGSYCENEDFDEYARYWANHMTKALGYKVNINDGL